jgi:hypothetical protein
MSFEFGAAPVSHAESIDPPTFIVDVAFIAGASGKFEVLLEQLTSKLAQIVAIVTNKSPRRIIPPTPLDCFN